MKKLWRVTQSISSITHRYFIAVRSMAHTSKKKRGWHVLTQARRNAAGTAADDNKTDHASAQVHLCSRLEAANPLQRRKTWSILLMSSSGGAAVTEHMVNAHLGRIIVHVRRSGDAAVIMSATTLTASLLLCLEAAMPL